MVCSQNSSATCLAKGLVLASIRTQLSSVEEDNAINMEAGNVFKIDKEEYSQTAKEWTRLYARNM